MAIFKMKRDEESEDDETISHLKVVVRVRPLAANEGRDLLCKVSENKLVKILDPTMSFNIPEEAFRINRTKERSFEFDVALGDAAT